MLSLAVFLQLSATFYLQFGTAPKARGVAALGTERSEARAWRLGLKDGDGAAPRGAVATCPSMAFMNATAASLPDAAQSARTSMLAH